MVKPDNAAWFARAQQRIPGGVNSPVRAFRSVGGTPRFIERAQGAWLTDAEGQRYVDYVGSWGPMIVGHAHPEVLEAMQQAARDGISFGAPTPAEVLFAEELCELFPGMDMVRLVSSGTEATMSAIRLARGATGRDRIVKFEGCYHGHADSLLVKAGSGLLTFGTPTSGGVPADFAKHTLVLPYNDEAALEELFQREGADIACVIVEPIAGNMNFVRARPGWLKRLRELTLQHGALLILDEVMTGLRVGRGSAQGLYGIRPDLTTLGKVIGGGMPLAAFGGRREVMEKLSPLGPVYQAGTLSGNPLAVAAGRKTLEILRRPGFYEALHDYTQRLCALLEQAAAKHGVAFSTDCEGGMFGFFFHDQRPANLDDMNRCDTERFKRFFHAALTRGVYFAPSAFEAGFVSAQHGQAELEATQVAVAAAMAEVA